MGRRVLTEFKTLFHAVCGFMLAVGLVTSGLAWAAPSPSGGCPPPPNTLIFTEFSVGMGDAPRWIELTNPGKYALSMKDVKLTIKEVGPGSPKMGPANVVDLGLLLDEIPAGEFVAIGSVPAGAQNALLKLKLLDAGGEFTLPCNAKISLDGPAGPIDQLAIDVCGKAGAVWGLDPAQTSPCLNDDLSNWCPAPPPAEPTAKPMGSPGKVNAPCDLDGDGIPSVSVPGAEADCNDKNKAVFPGAVEVCNGQDDDCNGQTDDSPVVPPGTCPSIGVCIAAVPVCYGAGGFNCDWPPGHEAGPESQCDGLDNDCNGLTDEGLTNACGTCGSPPLEVCNGKDDDCDGQTDDVVMLASPCTSTGVCAQAKPSCLGGLAQCVMPLTYEATETSCDGLDNDCDGQTDEDLGIGTSCTNGTGACVRTGVRVCVSGQVQCNAVKGDSAAELCGDALDNDCDGQTDEDFPLVGSACSVGTGICKVVGKTICTADRHAMTCAAQPLVPATEVCDNGLDDNCNGQTDESGCTPVAKSSCSAGTVPGSPTNWLLLLAILLIAGRRLALAAAGPLCSSDERADAGLDKKKP